MADQVIKNNVVEVFGKISSGFEFSHEVYGEGFYNFTMDVERLSEACDKIRVLVSERLLDPKQDYKGKFIEVEGQFRSYNRHENGKSRLILSVFAREVIVHDESISKNPNVIYLDGYVCKKPIYRTTPFGREITDLLIAVNRPYNKSDYIPAIAWGRNARFAEKLEVGRRIKMWGRIQSRVYQKKLSEENVIEKTAYEVSVSKMEIVNEETNNSEEESKDL
ncbi:single-stranded DNA-binding protein [Vallitalea okinawensis]|uniref:single-stranded DNA-binding protein n=1 Tax=Vallitalea okinawensis TaxID=2078660 RepID=UPI000CFD4517|nr:single-stranded DNA-binding protein [Vallitalea okinawensis]